MANVAFKICDLFNETLVKHGSDVAKRFEEFQRYKSENPMKPFGGTDSPFSGDGVLGTYKPKLLHAHMTHDISLIYFLSGANPTVVNLIGFFTHDEMGTGRPSNVKRQKNLIKRIPGQTMKPLR